MTIYQQKVEQQELEGVQIWLCGLPHEVQPKQGPQQQCIEKDKEQQDLPDLDCTPSVSPICVNYQDLKTGPSMVGTNVLLCEEGSTIRTFAHVEVPTHKDGQ